MNNMELLRNFNDRANNYLSDSQRFFTALSDDLDADQRIDTDANLVALKLEQIEAATMLLHEIREISSVIIDKQKAMQYADMYKSLAKSLINVSKYVAVDGESAPPHIGDALMVKIVKTSAESLKTSRQLKLT
jgi:hypothetical protein